MNRPYKATVGSISHGTMREADLIPAFGYELRQAFPAHPLLAEIDALAVLADKDYPVYDTEQSAGLLEELFGELDQLAPAYCYFGANEGDGSDYGFWPSMEAIEDLPRIQMVEGEDVPAEDHAFVSDHGNVTVFGADGSVLLELV